MNVVGVHNLGPKKFYKRVMDYLQVDSSIILLLWLEKKENRRHQQKKARKEPENKRKRVHKRNNKSKQMLYSERTSDPKVGTYGTGIGLVVEKKRKTASTRAFCACGGTTPHKNKSSKHCLIPKFLKKTVTP